MEKYWLFLLLALFSEIAGTVSGFGSSILFVPIASLYFDFKTVLGITAVFHIFSNLSKIALFREGINKEIVLKLGIPAIAFVILGAWLTTFTDTNEMELFMNIALLCTAIFMIANFNSVLNPSNTNLYLGGTMSGLLAGMCGTGGAVRGIVLSAFQLPKNAFVATSAFIDLGVDSSRAVIYISNGYFSKEYLILIPFLVAISIVGSYIGKRLLQHTSEKVFRYLVLILIVITSAINAINYFRG